MLHQTGNAGVAGTHVEGSSNQQGQGIGQGGGRPGSAA